MSGLAGVLFVALIFLLPFEPRRPALRLLSLQFTLLEGVALVAMAAGALAFRHSLAERLRRRPAPVLALAAYAAAHALSAALSEPPRGLGAKFALRMIAMACFACLALSVPAAWRRRALAALVASSALVAALAVAEAAGMRGLDPFLDLFREGAFTVFGARRATAGSEYPNQAAGFLACGLLAWAGLLGSRRGLGFALAGWTSAGLLFTYSRAALAAAVVALLCLLPLARRRSAGRGPLVALSALATAVALCAFGSEALRMRLTGVAERSWYAARYEPEAATLAVRPGEARNVRVRVTNAGRRTWRSGGEIALSHHWFDRGRASLADGGRSGLPRDVAAGESVEIEAALAAPEHEGRYLLLWDLVEGRTWFSGHGVTPASVEVVVGEPPAARASEARAGAPGWQPGRADLWRAAFRMWQAHPVLGAGPDGFRWQHGRYLGQPYWDTRVFANNTLLEAAATTGSLGVLALALALLLALQAAHRGVLSASPRDLGSRLAFFGILLGLLLHGLADYLLAFTGHYLLFAFAVGSASAARFEPDSADRT